jgi:ABC-type dipeptide/oligopeptide/nickel transport system ATPase subunit
MKHRTACNARNLGALVISHDLNSVVHLWAMLLYLLQDAHLEKHPELVAVKDMVSTTDLYYSITCSHYIVIGVRSSDYSIDLG